MSEQAGEAPAFRPGSSHLRAHALAAAKRRRGRGIYLCQACGKWHVGSDKFSKKSFRRKRDAKLANKQFYMVR